MKYPSAILFVTCTVACQFLLSGVLLAQSSPKTIYLAPDDHTDYFWTADDVQYRDVFIETLDYYLDRIDESTNQPPEFQPKWNCDGSLWLWEYEHHKTKKEFDRLMKRVADGHISSPLNALVSTYGGQPAEAVLRGMFYAGDLQRRFGVKFPLAVAMENQTLPLGLGSLWAGAGAKYSWRGICGCATKMPYAPFQKRDHEIYWWRGLDDSRILMKWYSLGDNNESVGGYAEARFPDQAINFVTGNQDFLKRHPYATIGLFGQGWDDLKTLKNNFPQIARRRTTKDQRVIVSNEEDFFRAFERAHGGSLPVVTEAYGNEWDILCASMAEQTARVRRAIERLRTAEALAAIVHRHDVNFWAQHKTERDLAHMNLGLYWEHDWTADSTEALRIKRAQWQKRLANQIASYVDRLQLDAQAALASMVDFKPPSNEDETAYLVFNPLGCKRDAIVKITGDFPQATELIDVNTQEVLDHCRIGEHQILVRVKNIPPVGFTCIRIGPQKADLAIAPLPGGRIESSEFSISVDTSGMISSVIEKKSGRELVGAAGFNVLMMDGKPVSTKATFSAYKLGTLGQQLLIQRTSPIKSQSVITLIHGEGISIENKIQQNFSRTLSWSFDLPLQDFELQHEEVGAIVKADLVSKGGHYANRNARYDWLSVGHFARLAENKFCVDIANHDCSFFKFGQSTPQNLDTDHPQVQFLIGGQIDGPKLGIRDQHGDQIFTQRFSIDAVHRSQPPIAEDANVPMRWALEKTNPAIAIKLNSDPGSALPLKYSLIEAEQNSGNSSDSKNVILWAIKPAEDTKGSDLIARWWNISDGDIDIAAQCKGLQSIHPTSHIETDLTDEKTITIGDSDRFKLPFWKYQMRTFRLKFFTPEKWPLAG